MRAKVTADGVVIPKQMLLGVPEVEIQERGGMILVLPLAVKTSDSASEPELPLAAAPDDLPTRQRRLAQERHPGAYVVLLEERIVHHSTDRQEALRAYREAASAAATARPVIISPDARPKRSPILRGRSLKRARTV